jgi:hypothetical protein
MVMEVEARKLSEMLGIEFEETHQKLRYKTLSDQNSDQAISA